MGRLVLEAYDTNNETQMTVTVDAEATPLQPSLLDHTFELPASTRSVRLILLGKEGNRIGEVARSEPRDWPKMRSPKEILQK